MYPQPKCQFSPITKAWHFGLSTEFLCIHQSLSSLSSQKVNISQPHNTFFQLLHSAIVVLLSLVVFIFWSCYRFTPDTHSLLFSTKLKEIPVQVSGVLSVSLYISSSCKGKMFYELPSASDLYLLNPARPVHSALGFPFRLCALKSASRQKTKYHPVSLVPPA